jgi:hypothetical protein
MVDVLPSSKSAKATIMVQKFFVTFNILRNYRISLSYSSLVDRPAASPALPKEVRRPFGCSLSTFSYRSDSLGYSLSPQGLRLSPLAIRGRLH